MASASPSDRVPSLPDLDSRAEIHDLVVRFYREITFDDLLAPVFGEVAEVDWSEHLPRLIDYWCRVLLGHPGYEGQLLRAHRDARHRQAFDLELFDRWYSLFVRAVDERWAGPNALRAKRHAARVTSTVARQLLDVGLDPTREGAARRTGFCVGTRALLIALLVGIGALLAVFGRWNWLGWHGRDHQELSFRAPDRVALTPSQKATAGFFLAMAVMFLVQTLVGVASQHYRAEIGGSSGSTATGTSRSTWSAPGTSSCRSSGWSRRSSLPASSWCR